MSEFSSLRREKHKLEAGIKAWEKYSDCGDASQGIGRQAGHDEAKAEERMTAMDATHGKGRSHSNPSPSPSPPPSQGDPPITDFGVQAIRQLRSKLSEVRGQLKQEQG